MIEIRRIFEEHRPNPGYCLVIRPMHDDAFNKLWDAVAVAFDRTFAWRDVGQFIESGDIMDAVLRAMAESDVIVADMSAERANVFYELGIAHAMKGPKKVILVTRVPEAGSASLELPFDVRGMRVVPYDAKSGMDVFLLRLEQAVLASLEGTTWFHLATNKTHHSKLTRGVGGNYRFDVKVLAITGDAALQNEGVDIELTVRREASTERGIEGLEESMPVTLLLHDDDQRTYKIPYVPWRLRSEGHANNGGEIEAVICMVPDRR